MRWFNSLRFLLGSLCFMEAQSLNLPQRHRYRHGSTVSSACRRKMLSTTTIASSTSNSADSSTSFTGNEASLQNGWRRFRTALGTDEKLDPLILRTAIPSIINLAVVPLVNAVDTFWVGRMGIALALAGQAAANQAFFALYFLINYLPTITAPLVASAVGSGNEQEAQERVCQSIFLSTLLGSLATIVLVGFPKFGLSAVLPPDAPARIWATPYLRWRGVGMVATLVSATGFAAYRGLQNTVTPLKVSLAVNVLNLVLDPLLMFTAGMGYVGAAAATAVSEVASGITYLRLLKRKGLIRLRMLWQPPPLQSMLPLIQGGTSMMGRQLAINVGIVSAARRAQAMDPSGVAAAAYGIAMQMYSVGVVIHVAMQFTAAGLVPNTLAKSGASEARNVADRLFVWGTMVGLLLGVSQYLLLPSLVPVFSTLPNVRQAVKAPGLMVALLHVVNGFLFVGEGTLLGLGCYRDLMLINAGGVAAMVASLAFTPLGHRLDGILLSIVLSNSLQAISVIVHYLRIGALANRPNKC